MSTTLSTTAMISELSQRLNNWNITSTYLMDKLNESYRWMESLGSFVWNVISTTLALSANTLTAALPAALNPGKMISITLPSSTGLLPVTYKPFDEFQKYRSSASAQIGFFGAWTMVYDVSGKVWNAVFGPDAAQSTSSTTFSMIYHRIVPTALTQGTNIYFPTPDELDDLIVGRAEAVIKQRYGILDGAELMKYTEAWASRALSPYASNNETRETLEDLAKRAQETAAKKANIG